MNRYYQIRFESDELCHYGITGQKWGVKRYQNSDGSYTDIGRERHRIAEAEANGLSPASDKDVGTGDTVSSVSSDGDEKKPASIFKVQTATKKKKDSTGKGSGKGKGKGKKGSKAKDANSEKAKKTVKPKVKARRLSEYASKVRKFKSSSRNEQLSRVLS